MTMTEATMETNGSGAARGRHGDADECPLCDGTGLRMEERPVRNGSGKLRVAVPCDCRTERRAAHGLTRARVPKRYEHCSLENFETRFREADGSLAEALLTARGFVRDYPAYTEGKGMLLVGTIGVGKTHLAVGVLDALVREKGATGLFCDYRDLLKQIQHSYNPQTAVTEMDVLQPVFDAEVLVLDELGASKPTEWVWDTVAHILNTRYNDKRTTILTTNYLNLPPPNATGAPARVRDETLGDRIGERMRSRLMEMCVTIEMRGPDWRKDLKRATFGGERFRG
jgi:DNA replication protein DnaC